jgi:GTP-binding protein
MPFVVAIVGRPNVGKSTLFNRLVGRRVAMVDPTPGVTRDRREGDANLAGMVFTVVDTAGFDEGGTTSLESRMRNQTAVAIEGADAALFLFDARAGITPVDEVIVRDLRLREMPVILVGNKAEGRAGVDGLIEGFRLGLGEPIGLSAEHGDGLAELYAALRDVGVAEGQPDASDEVEDAPLRLAVVGRPNAGKSTLINQLIGEERMITGPEPGLTRDSIALIGIIGDQKIELVDTAGIRKKARIHADLEKMSAAGSLRAIGEAELVVLLIDGERMLEKQDLAIANRASEEGRALVVAINKWDIVKNKNEFRTGVMERLADSLPQMKGVEIVTLSALTGKGLDNLMPAIMRSYEKWNMRVGTGELNRWLENVTARHPPPAVRGKHVRLRYVTQIKARPPTFVLFTGRPDAIPDHYVRYMVNDLRERFGLDGTPLRLLLRKSDNPYVKSKRKK